MKFWLALDIGCIECGEETNVLGVFKTKKEAADILGPAAKKQQGDWKGQHDFEVFEIEVPDR